MPFVSFGQKTNDYEVYKKTILHQFELWEIDIDTIPIIVLATI